MRLSALTVKEVTSGNCSVGRVSDSLLTSATPATGIVREKDDAAFAGVFFNEPTTHFV